MNVLVAPTLITVVTLMTFPQQSVKFLCMVKGEVDFSHWPAGKYIATTTTGQRHGANFSATSQGLEEWCQGILSHGRE